MRNGIYSVTFSSNQGKQGSGVAIVTGDMIYGGDAGYYYKGSIQTEGQTAIARIQVARHQAREESIFGPLNDFTLEVSGTPNDEAFNRGRERHGTTG
jgi:hypothetical protein